MNFSRYRCMLVSVAALLALLPYERSAAEEWQTPQTPPAAQQMAANTQAAPPATYTEAPKFYQITRRDVADEVARQLQLQGVEKKATASVGNSDGANVYGADHPVTFVLHGLQVDPNSHRWQAQLNILNAHKTEIVKPVAGFYEAVVSVPMLVHQVSRTDVIAATDINLRDVPSRSLRKDTITDPQALIGKSPRATISAERAIRSTEISAPVVIHRGEFVEMTYSAPYMHIKTTGVALEDGELGGMLRVKNSKSEKAISARVTGAGKVEANLETGA